MNPIIETPNIVSSGIKLICPICGWQAEQGKTLFIQMAMPWDGDYCLPCWTKFMSHNIPRMIPAITEKTKEAGNG